MFVGQKGVDCMFVGERVLTVCCLVDYVFVGERVLTVLVKGYFSVC